MVRSAQCLSTDHEGKEQMGTQGHFFLMAYPCSWHLCTRQPDLFFHCHHDSTAKPGVSTSIVSHAPASAESLCPGQTPGWHQRLTKLEWVGSQIQDQLGVTLPSAPGASALPKTPLSSSLCCFDREGAVERVMHECGWRGEISLCRTSATCCAALTSNNFPLLPPSLSEMTGNASP